MSAHSKFDICSRALALIGVPAISAFDEGPLESIVAGQFYDPIVEELITMHDWFFAIQEKDLSVSGDVDPHAPWESAYRVPAECLQERGLFVNGEPIEYQRTGDHFYTTTLTDDVVTLEYFVRPDEGVFTPVFRQLLTYRLAFLFAAGITRSADVMKAMDLLYTTQLATATFQNSISGGGRRVRASKLRGFR